ncbi:hypothetical protein CRENPOLYSF1_350023 [Crenothrix polyspora]|uniref:Uncharacterized protein n=1 Tax=Crenothrix polyspora TaxID=360316 RepID=A0A1R4HAM4_9GAMM|nr:hypothetical protein CRENPOLYSF1_350023 [Crenothrix polyspora]
MIIERVTPEPAMLPPHVAEVSACKPSSSDNPTVCDPGVVVLVNVLPCSIREVSLAAPFPFIPNPYAPKSLMLLLVTVASTSNRIKTG